MAQAPKAVFVSATSTDGSVDAVAVAGSALGSATGDRPGLWELVGQLPGEVRDLAKAEVGLYKAQAVKKAVGYGTAIGLLIGALLIAGSAITALFVGLILTLATLIGPGWSTLAVVLGALALAGLLAWLGIKKFSGGSDSAEKSS